MNDVKLRLDYFLSLGLRLVDGDIYSSVSGDMLIVGDDIAARHANVVSERDKEKFITSLEPRKNTGVQPVGDSVPVIVYWGHDNSDESLFGATDWEIELDNINIATWKPSIDALIKMQIQNDELNIKKESPRMKVEYVKVDPNEDGGSFWECARDFVEGGMIYVDELGVAEPVDNHELLFKYKTKRIYRKVEIEITWQGELKEYLENCEELNDDDSVIHDAYKVSISESCKFNKEFIKMCHLVASMTDKPK